jgi:hypothetical protein
MNTETVAISIFQITISIFSNHKIRKFVVRKHSLMSSQLVRKYPGAESERFKSTFLVPPKLNGNAIGVKGGA